MNSKQITSQICAKKINVKNLKEVDGGDYIDTFIKDLRELRTLILQYENVENFDFSYDKSKNFYLYGFELPQGYFISNNLLKRIAEKYEESFMMLINIKIGTFNNNIFCGININTNEITNYEKILICKLRSAVINEIKYNISTIEFEHNVQEIKRFDFRKEEYKHLNKGKIYLNLKDERNNFLQDLRKIINLADDLSRLNCKEDQIVLFGFSLPTDIYINQGILKEIHEIFDKHIYDYKLNIQCGHYGTKYFYGIPWRKDILAIEEIVLKKFRDLIYDYLSSEHNIQKNMYTDQDLCFVTCGKTINVTGLEIKNQTTWYDEIEDVITTFKKNYQSNFYFIDKSLCGFSFPKEYFISKQILNDINEYYFYVTDEIFNIEQFCYYDKINICGIISNKDIKLIDLQLIKLLQKYIFDQLLLRNINLDEDLAIPINILSLVEPVIGSVDPVSPIIPVGPVESVAPVLPIIPVIESSAELVKSVIENQNDTKLTNSTEKENKICTIETKNTDSFIIYIKKKDEIKTIITCLNNCKVEINKDNSVNINL